MSNNLYVNVLSGLNYQMPQFQVSSAYTKRAMAKNAKMVQHTPFSPIIQAANCFCELTHAFDHSCSKTVVVFATSSLYL